MVTAPETLEAMDNDHLCATIFGIVKEVFPSARQLQGVESKGPFEDAETLRLYFPLLAASIERKGVSVLSDGTVKLNGKAVEYEELVMHELSCYPELRVLETAGAIFQHIPSRTDFKNAFRIDLGMFVSALKQVQMARTRKERRAGNRRKARDPIAA